MGKAQMHISGALQVKAMLCTCHVWLWHISEDQIMAVK
jgi:hypothetical protein